MNTSRSRTVALGTAAITVFAAQSHSSSFVNFETAPVHPIALSPDQQQLAVCNLADGRVEIFDVTTGVPVSRGSVPVGIDPVSVRFRTTNELWVVNHISSSVNVVEVDRMQVIATLEMLPGAADVVFAGAPQRAFVSCASDNTVRVFDPATRQLVTNLVIDGDRPKAMTVSPDGSRVYVAIFESGNASTILAPPLTPFDIIAPPSVVSYPGGPYGGQDPPPNASLNFNPPLNPNLEPNAAPTGSHIIKKNASGRWMDDNNGDWTEFVSGTNAAVSGRVVGWDMPDRDVAIIDTATFATTYATGLMNICMDVAANPASGKIAVIGIDATNERRFEPNLRGTFVRVKLALVDPLTLAKSVVDLNPHLDYSVPVAPQSERDRSLGDPRSIIWNSAGTRGYITGMGSRNLVVIDGNGQRVGAQPVELDEGPTGMALDESRTRLYVWNRFSATLSVLDTASLAVVTNVALFDPTPVAIRNGRKHLYDTRRNSGLGQVSCASCHVDARFDRLAWDLGNPAGEMIYSPSFPGSYVTNVFHPMKGPMVTQTFQDMLGVKHWRGDRAGLEDFNVTFTDLLGRDAQLATNEMQEFKDFLATIVFPPNRFRNLDNTFSTNVPLPGQTGVDWEGELNDVPLPNGNARNGFEIFARRFFIGERRCDACHNGDSGNGFEQDIFELARNNGLRFKGQQLRSLADKLGMNMRSTSSRAGFGFFHDGRADTLTSFLRGAGMSNNQDIADTISFLLSFSGGGTGTGSDSDHQDHSVPAAIGRQTTVTNSQPTPLLQEMLRVSDDASRVDLIVRGRKNGINRSWFHVQGHGFQSDHQNEVADLTQLLSLASSDQPLTFTMVLRGTGQRLGLDRDDDGYFDRTEIEVGTDPLDPLSKPANVPPQLALGASDLRVHPGRSVSNTVSATDADEPLQTLTLSLGGNVPPGANFNPTNGLFTWTSISPAPTNRYSFYLRAIDNGSPPLSDTKWVALNVVDLRLSRVLHERSFNGFWDQVLFDAVPGNRYSLELKSHIDDAWFEYPFPVTANGPEASWGLDGSSGERYYRIKLPEE